MVAAKKIESIVMSFPEEKIFSISDLHLPSEWWENIRVKLGRMVTAGALRKSSKGRFYRPSRSVFGELAPREEEVVKDLLEKNGERIGYITGYSVWNQMGLTSQISGIIQIGTNSMKRNLQRGFFTIKFIKQPNPITKENIKYLMLLDALNNVKKIPDTTVATSVEILTGIIRKLNESELRTMISLAMAYPPRLRALLGAIVDGLGFSELTAQLHSSLNPLTTYSYPGISLSNPQKWHLK